MSVKISVVTITYNSEATLRDTIESVLGQDYDNLEYLVIDGGSKDGTLDVIKEYRDKIAYFVSERDNGISDAFNKGVSAATGEIIGIINSDDILLPGTLKALNENYDPSVDVYGFNVLLWNSATGEKFKDMLAPGTDFHCIYKYHNISHPGRFIRKDAYEKYGNYDIRLRYIMDHDLLVRFYKKGACFKNIDYDGALFRLGGATDDSIRKIKEDYKIYTINNGGNVVTFHIYYGYKVLRNGIKRLLYLILPSKNLHIIRGRKKL